jgi:hypothetical protein
MEFLRVGLLFTDGNAFLESIARNLELCATSRLHRRALPHLMTCSPLLLSAEKGSIQSRGGPSNFSEEVCRWVPGKVD